MRGRLPPLAALQQGCSTPAQVSRHNRALLQACRSGGISFAELDSSVQGWVNHASHGNTWGLREHVFSSWPLRGDAPTDPG